jgi:hypothetical protein
MDATFHLLQHFDVINMFLNFTQFVRMVYWKMENKLEITLRLKMFTYDRIRMTVEQFVEAVDAHTVESKQGFRE